MEKSIGEEDFLSRYVTWALWALAVVVVIATITGQVESFNGLYIWFATHHVTGFWADFAPLAVDSFTVIGELAIFAGIARHWDWKSRVLPWCSAVLGICSSVAANVGDKVQFHSIPTDLTGAIFPLAGAFGLVIGLGVLKRVAKDHAKAKQQEVKEATNWQEAYNAQLELDKVNLERKLREAESASVLNISPEGLKEAQNEQFEVKVQPFEAPYRNGADVVAGPSVETLERIQTMMADRERKGMDVLIPPQPPVESPTVTTAQSVEPVTVSREEARRRESDLRPGRPVINPSGLDVRQTGSWSVIPADA